MIEKPVPFAPTRLNPADLEARKQVGPHPPVKPGEGSFADALRAAEAGPATVGPAQGNTVRFSAHAEERLRTRDIRLSAADTAQINRAVEIAGAKGARESLILYDDLALIVSVRNKLVITALERGGDQANVFTNIDAAVVLPGSRS